MRILLAAKRENVQQSKSGSEFLARFPKFPPRAYGNLLAGGKTLNHTSEDIDIEHNMPSTHHQPLQGPWCACLAIGVLHQQSRSFEPSSSCWVHALHCLYLICIVPNRLTLPLWNNDDTDSAKHVPNTTTKVLGLRTVRAALLR